ncbi:MAG: DUF2520 domain-containing protein [Gemmatimonadaceae bacterium]
MSHTGRSGDPQPRAGGDAAVADERVAAAGARDTLDSGIDDSGMDDTGSDDADIAETIQRPILIVGAGRAGQALAAALDRAGLIVRLHGRAAAIRDEVASAGTGSGVVRSDDPVGALPADIGRAGVVLVSVRDEQLDAVVGSLADAAEDGRLGGEAVVLQLSGSREPAGLQRLRAAGRSAGTFHPLLPLTASSPPTVFRDAWIGVEGDHRATAVARALVGRLGGRWLRIPAGSRPAYHAAAVLASNFPLVLAALAARLLRDAGVEPAAADGAVRALLSTAAANIAGGDLDAVTVAHRLTGPIARGDGDTVAAHRLALAADPVTLAVYDSLSRAALDVLRAGGTDPRRLDSIAALLAD